MHVREPVRNTGVVRARGLWWSSLVLAGPFLLVSCMNNTGSEPSIAGNWSGTYVPNGSSASVNWTMALDQSMGLNGPDSLITTLVACSSAAFSSGPTMFTGTFIGSQLSLSGGTGGLVILGGTVSGNSVSGTYSGTGTGCFTGTGTWQGLKQ